MPKSKWLTQNMQYVKKKSLRQTAYNCLKTKCLQPFPTIKKYLLKQNDQRRMLKNKIHKIKTKYLNAK